MNKNNEYRKLQSWDPKPKVQRAVEKKFYNNETLEMRHKMKSWTKTPHAKFVDGGIKNDLCNERFTRLL